MKFLVEISDRVCRNYYRSTKDEDAAEDVANTIAENLIPDEEIDRSEITVTAVAEVKQ